MQLTEYETTVVIRPDIGGDAVEGTLDRLRDVLRNGGGKLLAINHWGKKKLAYEIKKHARGIYVHTHYLGGNVLVQELERNLRISDNVLRFMTIRMAEGVAVDEREEKAYVRPQYDVEEPGGDEPEFGAEEEYSARGDRDRDRDRDRGDRDAEEEAPESDESEAESEEA
jgi:small subunit ribosomal protein S6